MNDLFDVSQNDMIQYIDELMQESGVMSFLH